MNKFQGAWLVLCLAACGDNIDINPPAPAVDPTIPPEIEAGLDHDDEGRPILNEMRSMIAHERIALAFDKNRDDAVVRYGWCLDRVAACYRANPGVPISRCIDLVERCPDDTGGRACCAPACIAEFHHQRDLGLDERDAIAASFVRGDCQQGFAAIRRKR